MKWQICKCELGWFFSDINIRVHTNYDIHTIAKQKSTTNKYVAIIQYEHTTFTMIIQYTLQNKAD